MGGGSLALTGLRERHRALANVVVVQEMEGVCTLIQLICSCWVRFCAKSSQWELCR